MMVSDPRATIARYAATARQQAYQRGIADGHARAPISDCWLCDDDGYGLTTCYFVGYAIGLYREGER